MNILLLTHSYPDKNNPLKCIFIREQAVALSTVCKVTVVAFRVDVSSFSPFSGYSFSKVVTGNLVEYEVTIKKSFPVFTQVKYLMTTYRFIKNEILKNNRPDIIHSHLSYPGGFLGTIIQERKRIPNILTEHSKISSFSRSLIHKLLVKYTLKKANTIIAVSNSLKREINEIVQRPVIVLPNFVDTDKFILNRSKTGDKVNIGFIGGLGNNNKGLDLLLKAVSLLENKNVVLHICGFGSLLDDFRKMAFDFGIGDTCIFYGALLRDEIPDFYSRLDFFILPSRYETFGIVLIEAMACGLPVIATKCGGPEGIVTKESGLLIENNNVEAIGNAINFMAENINAYDREAIRNYAIGTYGRSQFIKKMENVYLDILTKDKYGK